MRLNFSQLSTLPGVSGEAEGDDIRALLPRDVQEPRASLLGSDVTRRLPEFSGLPDPG